MKIDRAKGAIVRNIKKKQSCLLIVISFEATKNVHTSENESNCNSIYFYISLLICLHENVMKEYNIHSYNIADQNIHGQEKFVVKNGTKDMSMQTNLSKYKSISLAKTMSNIKLVCLHSLFRFFSFKQVLDSDL